MTHPFALAVGLLLAASGCSSGSSNPQTPDDASSHEAASGDAASDADVQPDVTLGQTPDDASSREAASEDAASDADVQSDVALGGGSDGGSCFVSSSTYDQTCDADSDCVPVPAGGNICNGCSNNAQLFECDLSAVNVKASAAYRSALTVVLADAGCFSSCPQGYYFLLGGDGDGGAARCDDGLCRSAL